MKKLNNKLGMTMAEMLIVVAIIAVLSGVAFVSVWNYQRTLGQLERDAIAKEIYVAAQNHLTIAYGAGYLGMTSSGFGTQETATEDSGKEVYYFTVNGNISDSSILGQILPFGSLDETVRGGGSYIVRYQKNTGLVLDVFYCTRNGSPTQFNYALADSDYDAVLALRDTDSVSHKNDRKNWNSHILGWYGGADAALLPSTTLQAPSIKVVNAEKLYVEVTNPNSGISDAQLKLIITGLDSKAQKAYELKAVSEDAAHIIFYDNNYTVILDDVTSSAMHFGNISADKGSFIPGEDIEIQAVAYSTKFLTNIAYSPKSVTNSLFDSIDGSKETAYIGNIRHLENLDESISNLKANDSSDTIKIKAAEQTDSFSWIEFQKGIRKIESKSISGEAPDREDYEPVTIFDCDGSKSTAPGYYMPIEPDYSLSYDGKNHSISDVAVNDIDNAGLFGSTNSVKEIKNLELIDFSITGTTSAGSLAGTIGDCTLTNVLARNSTNSAAKNIIAPTAGGLIGNMIGGSAQYSAAVVIVAGNTTAGGLIGEASGTITGCYAAGHTKNGSYPEWISIAGHSYDVTGGTAGGLVGKYTGSEIKNSYSTCSVSGAKVGGFVGSASGSIKNCYATGLIDQTKEDAAVFAFLGSGSPSSLTGNYYFSMINESPETEGGIGQLLPMDGYKLDENKSQIIPIDLNTDTYNSFVEAEDSWYPARAYDASLVEYYKGKYSLETVRELNPSEELPPNVASWSDLFVYTHYGDWPAPEVFVLNYTK
ncbi:MAG: type II secretion system protein [Blautia sp.]|nr:type II secretion system protein [Blautia sp.]